jgi:hypothetical protein
MKNRKKTISIHKEGNNHQSSKVPPQSASTNNTVPSERFIKKRSTLIPCLGCDTA